MEGPVGTGVTDGDEGIRSPGKGAVSSGERRRLGAPSRTMSGLRPSRPVTPSRDPSTRPATSVTARTGLATRAAGRGWGGGADGGVSVHGAHSSEQRGVMSSSTSRGATTAAGQMAATKDRRE